jgi:hypothetical protein
LTQVVKSSPLPFSANEKARGTLQKEVKRVEMLQWRRFNFFDISNINDPSSTNPNTALACMDMTAVSAGRGAIYFGDSQGGITKLHKDWTSIR